MSFLVIKDLLQAADPVIASEKSPSRISPHVAADKLRQKEVNMERTNAWITYDLEMQKACNDFAAEYIKFISEAKTERECVDEIVNRAEKEGFVELQKAIAEGKKLKKGDGVYSVWMNKAVCLFRVGE